ncbi:MAG: uracil-DNA glycosylase [Firmicutes bacterium]|nr:uracil-DNA glycosylase [Bacillota bacterium]
MVKFNNDWDELLQDEFKKDYYLQLRQFLKNEYSTRTVYPDMYDIFNALKTTPRKKVKAVILGQDPYHEPDQAHGMCFSVKPGVPAPPSLQNIFKELQDDLGCSIPQDGYLMKWAEQGVLLLNTVLTVRAHQANSHKGKGWEIFTDRVIQLVNEKEEPVVFLLWGANARSKKPLITNPKHLILETVHPSPLSAYNGFFGCRHFSKANAFLAGNGIEPIDWQL